MISIIDAQEFMTLRAATVEESVRKERPELLDLFYTYQKEAAQARSFLDKNLLELPDGAEILEVGGGILALAVQLASEGFEITTVEPVGDGFGEIPFIMQKYLALAQHENLSIKLIDLPIEQCAFAKKFNYIFLINVMEHLQDPYLTLIQITDMLEHQGEYRFICPNYDFPYEPHFGKFLFSRKNKSFFLARNRATSEQMSKDECYGLYNSLNFLTYRKLLKCTGENKVNLNANKLALYEIFIRSLEDPILQARHTKLLPIVKLIDKLQISSILRKIPVRYQPVLDVKVSSR